MREILFRAKRADNGEWETGFFVIERYQTSTARFYITDKMTGYHTPIIPETVGQFTGLTDKNGKKIFEEDIIEVSENKNHKQRVLVFFEKGHFVVNHYAINLLCERNLLSEVIGNIHDNPELLEDVE